MSEIDDQTNEVPTEGYKPVVEVPTADEGSALEDVQEDKSPAEILAAAIRDHRDKVINASKASQLDVALYYHLVSAPQEPLTPVTLAKTLGDMISHKIDHKTYDTWTSLLRGYLGTTDHNAKHNTTTRIRLHIVRKALGNYYVADAAAKVLPDMVMNVFMGLSQSRSSNFIDSTPPISDEAIAAAKKAAELFA